MAGKIVLDLETQKEFAEVGGRNSNHKLRVSLCGVYSYQTDEYLCFDEKNISKLGEMLQTTDLVIGYNVKQFDFEVLQPYFNFPMSSVPCLDILVEVEKVLGHRIRLDVIAQATLGIGKTGSGYNAINLWRQGKIEELKSYCLNDVKLTKEIYDFAVVNRKLKFKDFFDVREISLDFPDVMPRVNTAVQSGLF